MKNAIELFIFLFLLSWVTPYEAHTNLKNYDGILKAVEEQNTLSLDLKKAIESKNSKMRAQAAKALGQILNSKVLPPLLTLSNDQNTKVRIEANFSLGQLAITNVLEKNDEKTVITQLSEQLKDPSIKVINSALEALGKYPYPEKTIPLIVSFLNHQNTTLQTTALYAIFRTNYFAKNRGYSPESLPDSFFELAKNLLSHRSKKIRQALAYTLYRTADNRGLNLLEKLLEDKSHLVKTYTLQAFSKIESKALNSKISTLLKDRNYQVKYAAIKTLIHNEGFDFLDSTNGLINDSSHHVRLAYAEALGFIPDSASRLEKLLNDSSPSVRGEALKGLAKLKVKNIEELIAQMLNSKSHLLRQAAIDAEMELYPKNEGFLLQNYNDPDVRVRSLVLEYLSKFDSEKSLQILLQALNSNELSERGTAGPLLIEKKHPEIQAALWNCYLNSLEDKWIELRETLVSYFANQVNDQTTRYLKEILNKETKRDLILIASQSLVKRGIENTPIFPKEKWVGTPFWNLRFNKNPLIKVETSKGEMIVELFANKTPIHVANLMGQIRSGFYSHLNWHRVVSNFVIQGGDPDKTGWGSAGYSMRAEINSTRFGRGVLGMPRSQAFDTGGVQLFFTHLPTPHLDGQYTAYGKIKKGLKVLNQIDIDDEIISISVL